MGNNGGGWTDAQSESIVTWRAVVSGYGKGGDQVTTAKEGADGAAVVIMDDETIKEGAKAAQEIAKATGLGIEAARDLGTYLADVFGTIPHDVIGIAFGDWLQLRRLENALNIAARAKKRLRLRGVTKPFPISPRLGLPLLQSASLESDDTLQDMWARLLANAQDPTLNRQPRQELINTLGQFEPVDARIFDLVPLSGVAQKPITEWSRLTGAPEDAFVLSVNNLDRLKCINWSKANQDGGSRIFEIAKTIFGRELHRACQAVSDSVEVES